MQENTSSQSISQSVSNNTGSVQALVSGRDIHVTQLNEENRVISKEEAIELIKQIESLIESSHLPTKLKNETIEYVQSAQKEAEKENPKKTIIIGNLEGAIQLIKNASDIVDVAKKLILNLQEPIKKVAYWLGIAAAALFG